MPLQNKVNTYYAEGVPGMPGDMNVHDYNPTTFFAEVPIAVGTFVWRGTDPASQATYSATGAPVGLVVRDMIYAGCFMDADGSLIVPVGSELGVAVQGARWVEAKTVATIGQSVFASTTDGSVSTGAAGGSVSGSTEVPGWIVEYAPANAAIGDYIIIKRS